MTPYATHLATSHGLSSTRAISLGNAMEALHASIGAMDAWHLKTMWREMPGLMEAVAEYGDKNPGLNDYRAWRDEQ